MTTTITKKAPVDLKAIIAKANSATKSVQKSTVKIQAKQDTYSLIPGFKKYEFNGLIVRNLQKRIMSQKKGNKKYQLVSDAGKNVDLSLDQIKALIPSAPQKIKKATIEKIIGDKKPSKKTQILALSSEGLSPKEIAEKTGFKIQTVHVTITVDKIKKLHEKGLSPSEIAEKTGISLSRIKQNI